MFVSETRDRCCAVEASPPCGESESARRVHRLDEVGGEGGEGVEAQRAQLRTRQSQQERTNLALKLAARARKRAGPCETIVRKKMTR
eukprot:5389766-Pleurochrysis_carterae.AAC.2